MKVHEKRFFPKKKNLRENKNLTNMKNLNLLLKNLISMKKNFTKTLCSALLIEKVTIFDRVFPYLEIIEFSEISKKSFFFTKLKKYIFFRFFGRNIFQCIVLSQTSENIFLRTFPEIIHTFFTSGKKFYRFHYLPEILFYAKKNFKPTKKLTRTREITTSIFEFQSKM